jgi:hypothetical protein
MNLYEYVGNLHMHTPYSDGEAYHPAIAQAAARAGLDFIVVTDHNVLVQGVEGYYTADGGGTATTAAQRRNQQARRQDPHYVLLLTGEEIHDQGRLPQVNHCLVYAVPHEIAQCAPSPQTLIDTVNQLGGMTFLAHPADHAIAWVHESAIPWVDWPVERFTGIEVWNYMSHFKDYLNTPLNTIRNILRPRSAVTGPNTDSLLLWDRLLMAAQPYGGRVVGIGNSDAHATVFGAGPLKKCVYPYEFLFGCVNTHILTTQPFGGRVDDDRALIWQALREGRCFIGYGVPGDPRGFRFSAQGNLGSVPMGGALKIGSGVTLQAIAPTRARIRLIHNGRSILELKDADTLAYSTTARGTYRVEVWRRYRGQDRCWILSNPIYLG